MQPLVRGANQTHMSANNFRIYGLLQLAQAKCNSGYAESFEFSVVLCYYI